MAYEQLRSLSLHHPAHEQGRWGMALFLGKGFGAWMGAWSQVAPKQEREKPSACKILPLPDHIQVQMVSALAGMVLGTLYKEVV